MYGVPVSTFPDPAAVFAAAAPESSGLVFAFVVIDRSTDDDGDDLIVRGLRQAKAQQVLLPPINDGEDDAKNGLRPAIVLRAAAERLARWRTV